MNYETYKKAEEIQKEIYLLENKKKNLESIKEIHLIKDSRGVITIEQLKESLNNEMCCKNIDNISNLFVRGLIDALNNLIRYYEDEFTKL